MRFENDRIREQPESRLEPTLSALLRYAVDVRIVAALHTHQPRLY